MQDAIDVAIAREFELAMAGGRLVVPRDRSMRNALRTLAWKGVVVRPAHAMYAQADHWNGLDPRQRHLALVRTYAQRHENWVFCQVTAAALFGLDVPYQALDNVCVATNPRSPTRSSPGVRRMSLPITDTEERDGIRVTPFGQTVFDCLRTLPFDQALVVADSALRMTGLDSAALVAGIERRACGQRGVNGARKVAALADARAENGGESMTRAHMYELGYAMPELQVELTDPIDPRKRYRADFLWRLPDGGEVVGELDGIEKYLSPDMAGGRPMARRFSDERRRESRILASSGRKVMRLSFEEACDLRFLDNLLSTYGIPKARV